MTPWTHVALVAVTTAAVAACGSSEPAPATVAIAAAAPAPAEPEAPAPTPPRKLKPRAASGEAKCTPIGVGKCDEVIALLARCAERMPAPGREAMMRARAQMCSEWAAAAATDVGRKALANACQAMYAMRNNSMCKP